MHESEIFFYEGTRRMFTNFTVAHSLQLTNSNGKYRAPELVRGTYQHGRMREVSTTSSVEIILHSGTTLCSLVRYGDVSEEMLPWLWMQHI